MVLLNIACYGKYKFLVAIRDMAAYIVSFAMLAAIRIRRNSPVAHLKAGRIHLEVAVVVKGCRHDLKPLHQ